MNQAAEKTQTGLEEQINISFGQNPRGVDGNKLKPITISIHEFYQIISTHQQGEKFGPYFLRGLCNGKRCDENMKDVQFVIIDGDKGLDADGRIIDDIAPDPERVHEALTKLNLNHALYTSHSHVGAIQGTDQLKVKWRVVIHFKGADWRAATRWIVDELNEMGLGVVCVPEMLRKSIPWFTARVDPDRVGTEHRWVHCGVALSNAPAEVIRHPAAFQLIAKDKGGTRPDIEPVRGIGRRLPQDEFLALFEAVKEIPGRPGQFMARCPAHHDNDPSLHITFDVSTGKTGVHCYSRCEFVEVLNAVNLNSINLPEQDPRTGNKLMDSMLSGFAGAHSMPAVDHQALPEAAEGITQTVPESIIPHTVATDDDLPGLEKVEERVVPDEVMNPPRLMGVMTQNIMDCGIRANPIIAFSTMLTGLSFFSLNNFRYGPLETPLGLYTVQIASTGDGKEDGRKWLNKIATRLNLLPRTSEDLASGPALLRSMAEDPFMLYMVDEYGYKLQQAYNSNGGNIVDLIAEEMKFFGKGCGIHSGKKYAESRRNIDPIKHPYLVKYATTTQDTLAEALTSRDATSGHLNRNLLFKGLGKRPPLKRAVGELNQYVVDCMEVLAQGGWRGYGNLPISVLTPRITNKVANMGGIDEPIAWADINPTKEADEALHQYAIEVDDKPADVRDIWSRARQQVIMVASLYCLSEWAEWILAEQIPLGNERSDPVLELKHVNYAIAVVDWSTGNWVELMADEVADNDFERLVNRIMRLVRHAAEYHDKKYRKYLDQGLLPKGFIANRIRVNPFLLDQALSYLVMAEKLAKTEQVLVNGNIMFYYREIA